MAYSFQKINELVEGEQQKANIFGGQGQEAPGGMQGQDGASAPVKTSTEGDLGGGGGSTAGEASKSGAVTQDQGQEASKAAFTANKGKTAQPKAFENIYSQLQDVGGKEQAEADKYVQTAKDSANAYDVGDEDIKAATMGGDAFKKVKDTYGKSYVDTDFANYIPETNYNVDDVDSLATSAGQKELIKRGQGPSYTSGMADFDFQALQGSPGYTDYVKSLRQSQEDIKNKAKTHQDTLRKQVTDDSNARLAQERAQIGNVFGDTSSQLYRDLVSKMALTNGQIAAQDAGAYGQSQLGGVLDQVKNVNPGNALIDEAVAGGGLVDPSQFVSRHDLFSNPYDLANETQANQFNRIWEILGDKSNIGASTYTPDQALSFDKDKAFQSASEAAMAKAQELGTNYDAELQKILQGNATEAETFNQNLAGLDAGKIGNDEFQNWWKTLNAEDQGLYGRAGWNIDPGAYTTINNPGYGADAFMSAEEAARANEIATKLGINPGYQASNVDVNAPNYTFNKDAFIEAANQHIAGQKSAEAQAAQDKITEEVNKKKEADDLAKKQHDDETAKFLGIKTGLTNKQVEAAHAAGNEAWDSYKDHPYADPIGPKVYNAGAKKDIDAFMPTNTTPMPFLEGLTPQKKNAGPGIKIGGKTYYL